MGPVKHSRKIKKIIIKGYEDQKQHQDAPASTKDLSSSHRAKEQTVRTSRKAKKRGEARQRKQHEAPHLSDSHLAGTISGFSPSFKKRYYGDLASNNQSPPVGNRTPRIPVIVPDRNATDRATPALKSAISSTKKNDDGISNGCSNFPKNKCSPDGRSAIMEATKGVEHQTFLETEATGDAEIRQTQQALKKRRMDQATDLGQTIKVEHETVMEVKEGNTPVGLLKAQQMFDEFISADDMLILHVLQSLVSATDKMSKLRINIPSGTLGKSDSTLSDRKDEGHSPVDLSKLEKPVDKCSASKTKKKKHTKLLNAEVPAEELNVAHSIDINKDSSNSDSARENNLPESFASISSDVYRIVPREINPKISVSGRRKMKYKMHSKKKYVTCNEGSDNSQARKLLHYLSSKPLRRWRTYEWFYRAVDFPWFMNNEFAKYLNHPYLRHISRLARSQWSIVRSYLGKPRRFSYNFLVAERKQLGHYHEKVRNYNYQLTDYLPADLARPFAVDEKVIICHPSSRELCDGKLVLVEQDCCMVQFDNPELGVDLIKDTDCMPTNWLDNLRYNIRSTSVSYDVPNTLEMDHVPNLRPSDNRDHTIIGASLSELPHSLDITPDKQLETESSVDNERGQRESTTDGTVQSVDFPKNNNDHYDQLQSYCSAFVRTMRSQARKMVDEDMQATSIGNDSQGKEAGAGNHATNCGSRNQATNCIGSEFGVAIPSNLIMNCAATVLAVKCLADSRHPPANIAGVLEHFSAMLRPTCSENLKIYNDIQRRISLITSKAIGLVPAALGNACFPRDHRLK